MDKEQARFALRSFRPDGADALDPDFAAALQLAAEDRELGEWLANERAMDAGFSSALHHVGIPSELRQEILAGLAMARGESAPPYDELDRVMTNALASLEPPAGRKEEVLMAMMPTSGPSATAAPTKWYRLAVPFAAAAGIALAFFLPRSAEVTPSAVAQAPVPLDIVRVGLINESEGPAFDLEVRNRDPHVLFSRLREQDLPGPGCICIPRGLQEAPGVGCSELVIGGKRGSLVCFHDGESGVLHLVIFRKEDILDAEPCGGPPRVTEEGKWSVATWSDDRDVYFLFGQTEKEKLAALF